MATPITSRCGSHAHEQHNISILIRPLAGKPAPASLLVDVPALLADYADLRPDHAVAAQRVAFGNSGHRGAPSSTAPLLP